MGLVHFRVDDRLIHGIVAGYWSNHLKASRILVIDNEASNDEVVRTSLRMACPSSIALSVLNLDKAIANINNGNYVTQQVFVIAKRPSIFLRLLEAGIHVEAVNMGNFSWSSNLIKIAKTVSLDTDEIAACESLHQAGTTLEYQLVPNDKKEDFYQMLKQAKERV